MYDLADLQVLFDSSAAITICKELVESITNEYDNYETYIGIKNSILVPFHNRILLINLTESPEYYYINNKEHMSRLEAKLRTMIFDNQNSLNEIVHNYIQERNGKGSKDSFY